MAYTGQHLLVDADDTLWENCAYFMHAIQQFLSRMESRGHDRDEVHRRLLENEARRTRVHGYGSRNFARSLQEVLAAIEGEADADLAQEFEELGEWIHDHPIEVFPGVAETLRALGQRHELLLVTKGADVEQHGKVKRSGLADYFRAIEVLTEKHPEAFRDVLARHQLSVDATWMIGNSPRSDINPAQAVGLRTVFIPHHTTWEVEDVAFERQPDLQLTRFTELTLHF